MGARERRRAWWPARWAVIGALVVATRGCSTFDETRVDEADGSTCERAIRLTPGAAATGVTRGVGVTRGTCGGDALDEGCANTPEVWFRATVAAPSYLTLTITPRETGPVADGCGSAYEAVAYVRTSCGPEARELTCDYVAGGVMAPGPLRIDQPGEVLVAVDGLLGPSGAFTIAADLTAQCATSAGCAPPAGVCNATLKRCQQCLTAADCKAADRPQCEPATGACVGCLSDADCQAPGKPLCQDGACRAGITPVCDAPAKPPSSGGCVQLGATLACNPVTGGGCSTTDGQACDFDPFLGAECYPAESGACGQACDQDEGPYCPPLQGCLPVAKRCSRYCCDDADCGASGRCDRTLLDGVPFGLCVGR